MSITLDQILALVGKLDDQQGDEVPRERFRHFLKENVTEVGQIRDYIEECLRNSGNQYSRALQDLINHLGQFLGFDVIYGRYQGIQSEIGFDGHWKSPTNFNIVVEIKTTEVYAVKSSTLIGYIDELISEKKIPNWEKALGLYIIGRPDPDIHQIENAILAEKRTHQLRIISIDSLLSLAEMMNEYDISHENILTIIRPSGPIIDSIVNLMALLVVESPESTTEKQNKKEKFDADIAYWLTPVKSDEEQTAEEVIQQLVGQEHIYAISERTPGRKYIKIGDWICFYATAKGVVAHGRIISSPEKNRIRKSDIQKNTLGYLVWIMLNFILINQL